MAEAYNKRMQLGIVNEYQALKGAGTILTPSGQLLEFQYVNGQNMILSDALASPLFSGHHEQPRRGHYLKVPIIGDAVAFTTAQGVVRVWGYVDHFTDLAARIQSRSSI